MYGEIQRENDFSSAQCCRMFEKKIGDGGAKEGYWRAKRSGGRDRESRNHKILIEFV